MENCKMIAITNQKDGEALSYSDDGGLLNISDGRRGADCSNGGNGEFNADIRMLKGNIIVSEISYLAFNLVSSSYTGAIYTDGEAGGVSVTLGSGRSGTLTDDNYITAFNGDYSRVNTNVYTLYVNGYRLKSRKKNGKAYTGFAVLLFIKPRLRLCSKDKGAFQTVRV